MSEQIPSGFEGFLYLQPNDRKARLRAKQREQEAANLREDAGDVARDGYMRHFALIRLHCFLRIVSLNAHKERHHYPPAEMLEELEDALDGMELEELGAAKQAEGLLRRAADWMELHHPIGGWLEAAE